MEALALALQRRENDIYQVVDKIRGGDLDPSVEETWLLSEAVALLGCLRRLVKGRTREEIHAAFGAPGDFGYGTPVGDALDALYRQR